MSRPLPGCRGWQNGGEGAVYFGLPPPQPRGWDCTSPVLAAPRKGFKDDLSKNDH